MLCPLTDRAGIDNNFISPTPIFGRFISSSLIISLNPLRIGFISLAAKSLDVISLICPIRPINHIC